MKIKHPVTFLRLKWLKQEDPEIYMFFGTVMLLCGIAVGINLAILTFAVTILLTQ